MAVATTQRPTRPRWLKRKEDLQDGRISRTATMRTKRRMMVCERYRPKVCRRTWTKLGEVRRGSLRRRRTTATEKIWLVSRRVFMGSWEWRWARRRASPKANSPASSVRPESRLVGTVAIQRLSLLK